MKALILGYGNPLRGDDGAAWEFCREASEQGWKTHCCQQLTPELVDLLKQVDLVYFVDAINDPGVPQLRTLVPQPSPLGSPHRGDPSWLLGLCSQLYPTTPKAFLLTLPGEDFDFHLGLSPNAIESVRLGLKFLT